ncbi:MAG: glycoside hydrolase family 2 protein [Planctomycetota bacterium]|jgi:beta-galactosidase/beta-glucuronidase
MNTVTAEVPRGEYPRPQFRREDWLCLNGRWEFEVDAGDSGLERGLLERGLAGEILVPFCPESELSGVGRTDFMNAVWYRREVEVPAAWRGRRVLLNFGAVDYDATVWVNGREVGRHRGGFTPFSCDLGSAAAPGETAVIVVRARDDHRKVTPKGKQCPEFANWGCRYTRTTGIWQTVWMEPVPESRLLRPRLIPDVPGSRLRVSLPVRGPREGLRVRAVMSDGDGEVARAEAAADGDFAPRLELVVPAERLRLWAPGDPFLYDLGLALVDAGGRTVDRALSYAGMRGLRTEGRRFLINGRPVFQRLVLDQGYYPQGIMTAPSDEALRGDIELALSAGFNGARLHQKVFEERFLYHADRLGYIVWGEFGDWGGTGGAHHEGDPQAALVAQWMEALERDLSHPCIVGWCPLNETHEARGDTTGVLDDLTRALFLATRAAEDSRPVLDVSGYCHRVPEADVYDSHDYTQDPAELRAHYAQLAEGRPFVNEGGTVRSIPYGGQPFFVSEFGGTWWNAEMAAQGADGRDSGASFGYGQRVADVEEFHARFEGLCSVLLDHPEMFGYCYTQLTDVFQEQNGVFTFDRRPKFDLDRIRAAQERPAACESGGTP